MVKNVYNHFDKQREWNDAGSSSAGLTSGRMTGEVPTRSDKTRRRLKSGPTPTNVVDNSSEGAVLEELMKIVCNLQIA